MGNLAFVKSEALVLNYLKCPKPGPGERLNLMRRVQTGSWKTYRMVKKKVFSGELKDYLVEGMEFDFNGAKVRFDGNEIIAPNIRGIIRKGWAVEVTPEEDEPAESKPKSFVDRAIEKKKKSIHLLPDGWGQMHWKKKVAFVKECGDKTLLIQLRRDESRAVKNEIDLRLEDLEEMALGVEAAPLEEEIIPEPPPRRKKNTGSADVEAAEDLARAIGAEIAPTGEEVTAGDEG